MAGSGGKTRARGKGGSRGARPRCCTTLVGTEGLFIAEEIRKIEQGAFGGRVPSLARVEASCKPRPGEESPDLAEVLDEMRTRSLFASSKLVVLRQVESLSEGDQVRLARAVSGLPAGTVVVLCLEKLRKASRLEKLLAGLGEVRRLRSLYDRPGPWRRGHAEHDSELTRWIVERAATRKIRISPPDAYLLGRKVGNHPARLDSEIEKLSLLVGPGGTVREGEIRALSPGSGEFRAFDLADAVAERNRPKALGILEAILREGIVGGGDRAKLRSLAGIGPMVVGALHSKLLELLRVCTLLEERRPREEVVAAIRAPAFLRETLLRQAKLHTARGLERALGVLLGYDRLLKGGASFPEAALERMVIALTRG